MELARVELKAFFKLILPCRKKRDGKDGRRRRSRGEIIHIFSRAPFIRLRIDTQNTQNKLSRCSHGSIFRGGTYVRQRCGGWQSRPENETFLSSLDIKTLSCREKKYCSLLFCFHISHIKIVLSIGREGGKGGRGSGEKVRNVVKFYSRAEKILIKSSFIIIEDVKVFSAAGCQLIFRNLREKKISTVVVVGSEKRESRSGAAGSNDSRKNSCELSRKKV
jgi:hypothetical protein